MRRALERTIARVIGFLLIVVAVLAFASTGSTPDPISAVGSPLVRRLAAASAAVLLAALPLILIGHLLVGRLPVAFGRVGFSWRGDRSDER